MICRDRNVKLHYYIFGTMTIFHVILDRQIVHNFQSWKNFKLPYIIKTGKNKQYVFEKRKSFNVSSFPCSRWYLAFSNLEWNPLLPTRQKLVNLCWTPAPESKLQLSGEAQWSQWVCEIVFDLAQIKIFCVSKFFNFSTKEPKYISKEILQK